MEAMETFELPAENAIAITEKRCYTVEDLQIILGISRGTVYKLLEQKEFRRMRIGTAYRISKKALMRGWMKISELSSRSVAS